MALHLSENTRSDLSISFDDGFQNGMIQVTQGSFVNRLPVKCWLTMKFTHAVDFIIRQPLVSVPGTDVRPGPHPLSGDETRTLVQRYRADGAHDNFRAFERIALDFQATRRRQVVAESQ